MSIEAEEKSCSFEEALARLENVVKELEDGRQPLEKSLDLFAEGIGLLKICNRHLEDAEQRILILIEDEKSELILKETDSILAARGEGRKAGVSKG